MIASSYLVLLLLVNNQYLINYFILGLVVICYHLNYSLYYLEMDKLLFNTVSHYDPLSISVILISCLVAIWLLSIYGNLVLNENLKINNEFSSLIILLFIGLSNLVISNNYLILFVSIELQSLILYILLATNIYNSNSLLINNSKVSLSYLINAAMATALLLFGISINSPILILVTILWKLGIIPVHSWSLPILDNVHSLIISIYLTLAKYGTLIVIGLISSNNSLTLKLLTYVGLLNLSLGNLLGLLQYRYQRIIVYSSLIQIGYMLLVISNQTSLAIGYFELYSLYTVMLLLLWMVPNYNLLNSGRLFSSLHLWTIILVFYTVAGLPFFPLFWTKLDILLSIQSESVIVALISTLLSSLIYIRLIKYMAFFQYGQYK